MRRPDQLDFARTGPGTLAGRYLRRFWQPVYVAADLPPGHARPLRIMSEDFTLYRGEALDAPGSTRPVPHAVAFRCAHRGTQLSTGWVEGDCIRCFYHGWKYDGSGQCVEQPAEDAGFASKVRIRSYPTQEYLGLIFACLGDAERGDTGAFRAPPLPRYPVLEADGVLELMTYTRACNWFNNWENAPDPVHLAITHSDSAFTHGGLVGIPEVAAEESEWGLTIRAIRPSGVRVTQLGMPNIAYIKNAPDTPGGAWQEAFAWKVPIDDEHHQSFNVSLMHVTGEASDQYRERRRRQGASAQRPMDEIVDAIMRGELRVAEVLDHPNIINIQDSVAQVGQGAIADRKHERLGRSDVGVIRLRQLWTRELRALAEGQPLKDWRWYGVEATVGV